MDDAPRGEGGAVPEAKRARESLSDERARRLAEKYERLWALAAPTDSVDATSADSFPASDPPSFTMARSGSPR
jgi:hypothetical protein